MTNRILKYVFILNTVLLSYVSYELLQLRFYYGIVVWASQTLRLDYEAQRRLTSECRARLKETPL